MSSLRESVSDEPGMGLEFSLNCQTVEHIHFWRVLLSLDCTKFDLSKTMKIINDHIESVSPSTLSAVLVLLAFVWHNQSVFCLQARLAEAKLMGILLVMKETVVARPPQLRTRGEALARLKLVILIIPESPDLSVTDRLTDRHQNKDSSFL